MNFLKKKKKVELGTNLLLQRIVIKAEGSSQMF